MSLPVGTWKAVVNGMEGLLRIDAPDAQGVFTGQIFQSRIKGFWNEAAQKNQFASYAVAGAGNQIPLYAIFEGYLFRFPSSPEPGRDVTATLVGSLYASAQAIDEGVLPGVVPTSRRQTFGWLATFVEVQ